MSFDTMTKDELKALAAENDVEVASSDRNADIANKLREAGVEEPGDDTQDDEDAADDADDDEDAEASLDPVTGEEQELNEDSGQVVPQVSVEAAEPLPTAQAEDLVGTEQLEVIKTGWWVRLQAAEGVPDWAVGRDAMVTRAPVKVSEGDDEFSPDRYEYQEEDTEFLVKIRDGGTELTLTRAAFLQADTDQSRLGATA